MSYIWSPMEEYDAEPPRLTDEEFNAAVEPFWLSPAFTRWYARIMAVLLTLLIIAQFGHVYGWWKR